MKDKARFIDKYAREKPELTSDIDIKYDDKNYFPIHTKPPLSSKFCQVCDENEDVRLLCQDCMCHHCNRLCMQDNKKNMPCTCRVGFSDEAHYG